MEADKKIIATAGIITVSIGTVNSFANHKTPPSAKFLLGSGVVYLVLSVLADAGQEEVAKALAVAVMTTVILGEGNGALSWLNKKGEIDTHRKTPDSKRDKHGANSVGNRSVDVYALRDTDTSDRVVPFPGIPATR